MNPVYLVSSIVLYYQLTPTTATLTCHDGWIAWGTSCYLVEKNKVKSWHDARKECQSQLGDLVIIKDRKEQEFLTRQLGFYPKKYWIGIFGNNADKWIDGSGVNYTNWSPGEPNHDYQKCIALYGIYTETNLQYNGTWDDETCSRLLNYICESKYECGGIRTDANGTITSPNYPGPYQKSFTCTWVIGGCANSKIRISVDELDVDPRIGDKCSSEYLGIFEKGQKPELACGTKKLLRYETMDNRVTINFVSDGKNHASRKGFKLSYTIVTPSKSPTSKCHYGWITWGTSCFLVENNKEKSWYDARKECQSQLGDLVIIKDRKEQDFLTRQLDFYPKSYWIGIFGNKADKWVDGSEVIYTNWKPGEPNSDLEECVEMYGKYTEIKNLKYNGTWNDCICSDLRNYICESKYECGEKRTDTNGTITSPNYPEAYRGSFTCTWVITGGSNSKIRISVDELDMYPRIGEKCSSDYLGIFEKGVKPKLLCGTIKLLRYETMNNKVTIKFVSDGKNHASQRGFKLSYTIITPSKSQIKKPPAWGLEVIMFVAFLAVLLIIDLILYQRKFGVTYTVKSACCGGNYERVA